MLIVAIVGAIRGVVLGRYTSGMKTAVSVPDKLFKEAERLARRQRKSRSRLYTDAIAEYVSRHDPQQVTRRINEILAKIDEPSDLLVREAGDRILRNTEWEE